MHKMLHFTMYVTFSSLFGCTTTQVATNSQEFNDDLTQYRIIVDESEIPPLETEVVEENIEVELPEKNSDEALSEFIKGMEAYNKKSKTVPGWRLLLYSGYDRDKAFELKEEIEEILGIRVSVQYEQPNYRVKVGNFLNRIDAHSLYTKLRRDFPLAIVVKDGLLKEDLKKGDQIIVEDESEKN